jgi:hypothetical protein
LSRYRRPISAALDVRQSRPIERVDGSLCRHLVQKRKFRDRRLARSYSGLPVWVERFQAIYRLRSKGRGPIMDTVFSFLISVGITAFGVWVVAGTIAAGSPLAWTFMGLLAVIVGLISLYGSVRDATTA